MGFGFSSCCKNVDKPKKKFMNQSEIKITISPENQIRITALMN